MYTVILHYGMIPLFLVVQPVALFGEALGQSEAKTGSLRRRVGSKGEKIEMGIHRMLQSAGKEQEDSDGSLTSSIANVEIEVELELGGMTCEMIDLLLSQGISEGRSPDIILGRIFCRAMEVANGTTVGSPPPLLDGCSARDTTISGTCPELIALSSGIEKEITTRAAIGEKSHKGKDEVGPKKGRGDDVYSTITNWSQQHEELVVSQSNEKAEANATRTKKGHEVLVRRKLQANPATILDSSSTVATFNGIIILQTFEPVGIVETVLSTIAWITASTTNTAASSDAMSLIVGEALPIIGNIPLQIVVEPTNDIIIRNDEGIAVALVEESAMIAAVETIVIAVVAEAEAAEAALVAAEAAEAAAQEQVAFSNRSPSSPSVSQSPSLAPSNAPSITPVTVTYSSDLLSITSNPERGFYSQDTYLSSSPQRLRVSALAHKRVHRGHTVFLRLYYFDNHLDSDLSQAVLDDITADFSAMRDAGVKCILRFAYKDGNLAGHSSLPSEPPLNQILSHIAQLKSILGANQDVLLTIQAGFIGPWGEWHSSNNFPTPAEDGGRDIVAGLLDAVPDRIVQIRTPKLKRDIYYGPSCTCLQLGGFEGTVGQVTSTWTMYMGGYELVTDTWRSGDSGSSVRVTNGAAKQIVTNVNAPGGSIVTVSGYSKADGTSTGLLDDYSILVEVKFTDGSDLLGQNARFSGNTANGWEYSEHSIGVPEGSTVDYLSIYTMYRNDPSSGTAYFDDIEVRVTSSNAINGLVSARTGHHNDCFLASNTDLGTYVDDDTKKTEYQYLSSDTENTAMGGETCALNAPRSDCVTAKEELELFHYTYLNRDYHPQVLESWVAGDCVQEIKDRLGYRIVLIRGIFPLEATSGQDLAFELKGENVGYAAPVEKRRVELILRHVVSGTLCSTSLDQHLGVDARTWHAGVEFSLSGRVALPADIVAGQYKFLLHITDPSTQLRTRLEYKTKVANSGNMNEDITGLIDLLHTITIQDGDANSVSSVAMVCDVQDEVLPNKIKNGGFEGANIGNDWGQHPTDADYVATTDESRTGTQSVRVNSGSSVQTVDIYAPEGSKIMISGYSKAVGTSTNLGNDYSIYCDVTYTDGSNLLGESAQFPGGTTAGWDYSAREFEVPAGKTIENVSIFAIYRNDPNPAGYAYFDDVKVTVDLNVPAVINGSFEGDIGVDWTKWPSNAVYAASNLEVHSGSQSVRVENGAANQQVYVQAPEGSTVTVSGYSKAQATGTNLGNNYSIYCDVHLSDGTYLWGQNALFSGGTTGWVYSERQFVVPSGKDVKFLSIFAMYKDDPAAGCAYFDDIKVTVTA